MIFDNIPISHEIQAFIFRNVSEIVEERGCGRAEAWDIFRKELTEKMTEQLNRMKEVDTRQQNPNQ